MNVTNIQVYELEITSNCNAECPLCARTQMSMPLTGNSSLSLEDIKQIFPDKASIENKQFALVGSLGDPILNPECLDICEYFSMNGGYVSLSTNAGHRTEEWWRKLASIPSIWVAFAVDGLEDTNHIYRVNVSWKAVERNMQAYVSSGGSGMWRFIAFQHNEHQVEEARSRATDMGLKFVVQTGGRNVLAKGKIHKPRKATAVALDASSKYQHQGNVNEIVELRRKVLNRDTAIIEKEISSISCRHIKENYAFIGSDKTLWHCCHLYSKVKTFQNNHGKRQLHDDVDPEWNSLEKYSITQILKHPYFVEIQSMWHPSHRYWTPACLSTCGKQGAGLDKEYIQKN